MPENKELFEPGNIDGNGISKTAIVSWKKMSKSFLLFAGMGIKKAEENNFTVSLPAEKPMMLCDQKTAHGW